MTKQYIALLSVEEFDSSLHGLDQSPVEVSAIGLDLNDPANCTNSINALVHEVMNRYKTYNREYLSIDDELDDDELEILCNNFDEETDVLSDSFVNEFTRELAKLDDIASKLPFYRTIYNDLPNNNDIRVTMSIKEI